MSQRQRIYVPGGTYHVVQRGSKQHPIFPLPDDYALFEQLLQTALDNTGARLHGYCWSTEAVHLALEIKEVSVCSFMQWLNSRYARRIQNRLGAHGHFFHERYDVVVIDPCVYLPKLIHYIHYVPVLTCLVQSPDDFLHTSHPSYLGASHAQWLHRHAVLSLLDSCDEDRVAYRKLMSEPPAQHLVQLLEHGESSTPGILGSPEFVDTITRPVPRVRRMTLDQITRYVCCILDVSREDVLSRSRMRKLALARAVIGWHAIVRGVATQAEVARYLGRDSSTLSQRINRYRKRHCELFKLDAFHHLVPIAPLNPRRVEPTAGAEHAIRLVD